MITFTLCFVWMRVGVEREEKKEKESGKLCFFE